MALEVFTTSPYYRWLISAFPWTLPPLCPADKLETKSKQISDYAGNHTRQLFSSQRNKHLLSWNEQGMGRLKIRCKSWTWNCSKMQNERISGDKVRKELCHVWCLSQSTCPTHCSTLSYCLSVVFLFHAYTGLKIQGHRITEWITEW